MPLKSMSIHSQQNSVACLHTETMADAEKEGLVNRIPGQSYDFNQLQMLLHAQQLEI